VVDDQTVASVKHDETKEVTVESGKHRIWMRISWCRSEILDIDVQDGDKIRLVCRGNARPGRVLLSVTTFRSQYIDLQLDT
jgi:hypothetical protein